MSYDSYPHDLDPLIQQIIRGKARRLTGPARLNTEDIEDLTQDFRAELLQKIPAYDPGKGSKSAFIKMLINRFFANWLRNRLADMRNPRRLVSLSVLIRNDEGQWLDLGNTIAQGVHGKRLGRRQHLDPELVDLRNDVEGVMQKMTHELRAVAYELMQKSIAAAARELGTPRTTLHEQVRQLRRLFERHDLGDFL